MSLFEALDHERVTLHHHEPSGLRAIVAIHSTTLGPSLGGLRIRRYTSTEEALADALRLSATMTLKAAAAGLDLGGGKAVILDDGDASRRPERLAAFADLVESLRGQYITAEDIGTTTDDMDFMAARTAYVVGCSRERGGDDPSPWTAVSVYEAVRCGLRVTHGIADVEGLVVGVVGLGKVGGALAERLSEAGARVIAYDVNATAARAIADSHGVEVVDDVGALLHRSLDVLCPCATGGLIDAAVAGALNCGLVAGAANNPLATVEVAQVLHDRGVLYVPDFLANCGGLISAAGQWYGWDPAETHAGIASAMRHLDGVLANAAAAGALPVDIAVASAKNRVRAARAARDEPAAAAR